MLNGELTLQEVDKQTDIIYTMLTRTTNLPQVSRLQPLAVHLQC